MKRSTALRWGVFFAVLSIVSILATIYFWPRHRASAGSSLDVHVIGGTIGVDEHVTSLISEPTASALDIRLWCYSYKRRIWTPCPDVKSGDKWRGEMNPSDYSILMKQAQSSDGHRLKNPMPMAPGWTDDKGNIKPINDVGPVQVPICQVTNTDPCIDENGKLWNTKETGTYPGLSVSCLYPKDPKHPEIPECGCRVYKDGPPC